MEQHEKIVNSVAAAVQGFSERGEPYRIFHGSSNSTRPRVSTNTIDISALSNVVLIDEKKHTTLVEPNLSWSVAALATQPSGEIDVIVSTVCPGACKSELARDFAVGFAASAGVRLYGAIFSKSPEEGARVYVSAAALGPECHGGWYKITALTTPGELVTSSEGVEIQDNVWSEIIEELRAKVPEVSRCL
ncbi:hypothetical protein VC83_00217 [Pseudogymnoascus destructans]|uniref:Uncharacterized protein n=2 Tax=Pseudogymnoascus destructans TaxID=655981 RepID=L8GEJ1_PSED2|nr:uncharacterized protein VC83_00217 [Pseudogymnoascus destructans]ELR10566.1 hypothetical protein GMDG_04839 [Pseudogymnoascus destructans 20631-21]OAF63259.1 hypothetical protein VC83_00217 [Pseudogymnoascus destructans]